MKTTYSLLLILLLATACWAQKNSMDNWNYIIVTPMEFKQKLIESMNKVDNDTQMMLFCWRPLKSAVMVNELPNYSKKIDRYADRIKIERIDNSDYFKMKIEMIKEIVECQKAIEKSKLELEELKKERDIIIKKLNLMRSFLLKKKKVKLNRTK